LAVKSGLDANAYPAGIKISDQQMAELRLRRAAFHGDWNYKLLPRSWYIYFLTILKGDGSFAAINSGRLPLVVS
jgi:hypothetical protein